MVAPNVPQNETERLKALYEYSILDTLPEKDFDDITKIAVVSNFPLHEFQ